MELCTAVISKYDDRAASRESDLEKRCSEHLRSLTDGPPCHTCLVSNRDMRLDVISNRVSGRSFVLQVKRIEWEKLDARSEGHMARDVHRLATGTCMSEILIPATTSSVIEKECDRSVSE